MWKVPFRQVYCLTFMDMVKQTLWCHVMIRVFPNVINMDDAPLGRQEFMQQYQFMFNRAAWTRVLKTGTDRQKAKARQALHEFETPKCPESMLKIVRSNQGTSTEAILESGKVA